MERLYSSLEEWRLDRIAFYRTLEGISRMGKIGWDKVVVAEWRI